MDVYRETIDYLKLHGRSYYILDSVSLAFDINIGTNRQTDTVQTPALNIYGCSSEKYTIYFMDSAASSTVCCILRSLAACYTLAHKIYMPSLVHFWWVTTTVTATPTLSSTMAALPQLALRVGGGGRMRQQTTENRQQSTERASGLCDIVKVLWNATIWKIQPILLLLLLHVAGQQSWAGGGAAVGGGWALVGVLTGIWSTYAATWRHFCQPF